MAESNATQVILTDDGMKIIKAQNTADNAAGGVTNLNDPNLMSVIEKQTQASQYAGLTSQYNVILKRAKDANISTTALTTAYTNLNTFMAAILTNTTKSSDVDRKTYKSLTDAYNTALSNIQTTLSNSYNADINNMQSSVSVASQAASSAVIVASQAATTGNNASKVASQAVVAANEAKSAGNNATSVASNASQAASSAILAGSTATVNANKALTAASQAQIAGNNATNVANSASQAASSAVIVASQATVTGNRASQAASDAILAGSTAESNANKAIATASQAKSAGDNATVVANNASQAASSAILAGSTATVSANKASADYQTLSKGVKDGSVVHITTETVIDKGVIGTAEIANGAITNAQIGSEAVGSAQIANLAVGTAQIGDGAITNAKIGKLAVGTAQIANGAITSAQIGSEAVGTAQIGKEAVGSAQIANLAVGTAQIGDGAITNAQIKDEAVNSAKIAKLAVGTAQIGDGAITNAKIGKLAVGTAQIANGAITEAQIGSLAVGTAQIKDEAVNSAKIAKLAVGTAQIGDGAITNAKIGHLAVGTAQIANAAITDAQVGNVSANKLTAGTIDFNTITGKNINASNITTGKLNTDRLNVNKLSAVSGDLGDITTGTLKGVNIVAKTFSTPNGSFTTDSNGAVVASNLTVRGVTNLAYNASLLGGVGGSNSSIPGWTMGAMGYFSNVTLHDGVPSIRFNGSTGTSTWQLLARSKLYPLNGLTGQPYSASVWFIDNGSEAAMNYQFSLAFFDVNGNRLASGSAGNTWNGNPNSQGWAYKTINNIVSPSTAVYVAIQLYAYNGKGNVAFSSPMLTQTAQSTGYMPDTGNVISAGEIDGSVINGSTINGTTFHGGDIINDANNMSKFYPTTISSDGHIYTTRFNPVDAMQTDLSTGALTTKYRAINTTNPNNHYEAYDTTLQADQIALFAGYTNGKDMSFTQSVTGSNQEGYVLISPLDGLTLHGDNQQITFNGTSDDVTPKGIFITPYGNINPNGTQNIWYVGNGPTMKTASFGIDGSGANNIQFNRSLDIGNFNINTYHTITSSDNGPIHFNRANGSSVDIFAATVNYTSLVKSSLLSVKKDVKKADTAYWAQLVNSIDLATYQYKTDDNTSHLRLSSIVDDVNVTKQWQLPDVFISRDENGKLSGVDDSVLLNATLATVQEQQKQIDQLNGHNMELEARLNKLEAKLNG
ncbi:phage tail protein [Lactiplantibacillus plantarum]|uniref:phage tail protein n=1 Tax=Lactiplantibacillus plantarum TaxID=1590 RepID=UPI00090ACFCC|nr:phage tail protein [Lactiplantibacillus plantarum]APD00822.1 phage tail protein [Lactiplantibacillus plantarum]